MSDTEADKNIAHNAAMKDLKAERDEMMRTKIERHGLLIACRTG